MNRPVLIDALLSVDKQTYPNLEIVLIDSTGVGLDVYKSTTIRTSLREVSSGTPWNRPAAANVALANAKGDFLIFLDEDDLIAPRHIEELMQALAENPTYLLAYSNTQVIDIDGSPTDFIFSRSFDAALLKQDNYLPIHSVLFSSSLRDFGCKFDEHLDIYEDWDFWLQCSTHSDFYHLPVLGAFYRKGGTSGTSLNSQREKYQKGSNSYEARVKIFDKWMSSIDGEQFNTIIGDLDRSDYVNKVEEELASKREHIEELDRYIADLSRTITDRDADISAISSQVSALEGEYRILETYAISLRSALSEIQSSRLWQLCLIARKPFSLLKRTKQRLGLSVTNTALGKRVYQAVKGSKKADTTALETNTDPLELKRMYSEKANKALSEFIAGEGKIVFPQSDSPKVSIIIILFNQAPLSLLCFQSLLDTISIATEVIIIDNASSDNTQQLLEKCTGATIIYNESNVGFVEAVNQGAAASRGEHILLLNNDAILQKDAVENAVETLESDEQIGAVGGKIVLLDGSLQEAGSIVWNDASCLGYGRGRNPNDPEFMFQREVDYCSGAFLLIKNHLFKQLNGFDLDYAPAYYEESDFCFRLKKLGYKVIYEPRAVVIHYEFASSGGYSNASKLQIAHREIFAQKHADALKAKLAPAEGNILLAREISQKPRILVIDDRVPHVGLGAGYPRCRHILKDLHGLGLQITFYPLRMPFEQWQDTYATLPADIEVMLDSGTDKLATFLLDRKDYYEHILVSRDHNMKFLNELLATHEGLLGNSELIYDAEAIAASREVLRLRLLGSDVSDEQAIDALNTEISVARLADSVICVSDSEAMQFEHAGHSSVYTLGHSCEVKQTPNAFEHRKDFLFVGSLQDNGSPNVDSLIWFAEQIFPKIQQSVQDDVRVIVVGLNGASELNGIKNPAFKFLGMQDDLTQFYNSCRVFIAPTRFAAGIPHKIHEAAAHGIPVVATDLLVSQLGWENEVEILSSEGAQSFATNCIRLYGDKDLWNGILEKSLEAVDRDCSPESFLEKLKKIFVRKAK